MRYTVVARREGDSWLATVTNLEGAHTFARTLAGLDAHVREMIALIEDLPEGGEESLDVDWTLSNVPDTVVRAQSTRARRLRAHEELREVERDTSVLVEALTGEGYSQRDQAFLLGITPGRVDQLASSGK